MTDPIPAQHVCTGIVGSRDRCKTCGKRYTPMLRESHEDSSHGVVAADHYSHGSIGYRLIAGFPKEDNI